MKMITGAIAAILLAGLGGAPPAAAQNVPRGSYMQSCTNVRVEGDRLVALCRRADGGMTRTALPAVNRCVGDIGNNNGQLQCNHAGGPSPAPGYQGPPPAPGYGGQNADCDNLIRQHRYLRHRLDDSALNGGERRHLERRLDEVRDQERADSCRR